MYIAAYCNQIFEGNKNVKLNMELLMKQNKKNKQKNRKDKNIWIKLNLKQTQKKNSDRMNCMNKK